MSQYLNLFLKRKNSDPSVPLCVSLCEFCTTPARQISGLGAFPYTESDIIVAPTSAESYLSVIIEERDRYKKYLDEEIRRKAEMEKNIYTCVSKEVFQTVLENIESIEQSISELEETVDDWDWIVNKIIFAVDVWKENKEEWNLCYHNC